MRTHVPLGLAAAAMVLFAPVTALAATPTDPMPTPDRCESIIPLPSVDVVQHRPLAEGQACASNETASYSPEARQKLDAWWKQIVGGDQQQSGGQQSGGQQQSQQSSNSGQQGQQSQQSGGADQKASTPQKTQ